MRDEGYSTIIDAVMFLAMVSACALVLSPAITGGGRQQAAADAGLRAMASSCLASLETGRVDALEYRILGDHVDALASRCGIDPGSWLYRDVTKAVLGRSSLHKPAMEVAAEAAACQFTVRLDGRAITLNPLTGEYRNTAGAAIDRQVRERLDERYAYNFTLRWAPFAGVPFEGTVACGRPAPPGAASATTPVTMPYRTGITASRIEEAAATELADMENATRDFRAGGLEATYRERLGAGLASALEKSGGLMAEEILGGTIYAALPASDTSNPLALLATFSDDDGLAADPVLLNATPGLEGIIVSMVLCNNAGSMDSLADKLVAGVDDGSIGPGEERDVIVRWLSTRYSPSTARATLSVWVIDDA